MVKKLILIMTTAWLASSAGASGSHYTRGYTTKNGSYVAPHYASNPNRTKLDNYSTKGNYNPYTAQPGTVDPYKPSASNPYGSPYNTTRPR